MSMAKTADSDSVEERMRMEYDYTWPTEHDLPLTFPMIKLEKKEDRGREGDRTVAAAKNFKTPPAESEIPPLTLT